MKTCSTCKHWGKVDIHNDGKAIGLGACSGIPQFKDAVGYDNHGNATLKASHSTEKAFTADCDNYFSRLITAGDFGCTGYKAT